MKCKTVLFDLDGTVLNTLGDLTDSVNCAIVRRGFPAATEAETRLRCGNGIRTLITQSIPEESRTESTIDFCLDEFRMAYQERMENRTQPYDGIVPLLKELKKQGIAVGVISNKYDLAAKRLIRHYFGDLVQQTYGESPDAPRKPDPTGALRLLKELGGSPETTLYVGDSQVDMETARRAQLTSVGVTWGFRSREQLIESGANFLIDKPGDLLPLLNYSAFHADTICQAFQKRGFACRYFPTKEEARDYLVKRCAGRIVTLGGSVTLQTMGFPNAFTADTEVHWHWINKGDYMQTPDIYLASANALSEQGEIVNIDGTGNRVAGTLFGAKECVFVCGIHKLCPNLSSAITRARTIAAPRNARRLHCNTPCAEDGVCHDCDGPNRICRAMTIHMAPPLSFQTCEVVLIGESIGY